MIHENVPNETLRQRPLTWRRAILNQWVAAKVAYDSNRNSGDPLHVGLQEAREAFIEEALKDKAMKETPREKTNHHLGRRSGAGSNITFVRSPCRAQ